MIFRAVFLFLFFSVLFFAFFWALFRAKFFSAGRVKEIAKISAITLFAILSAGMAIAFIIAADKLT